MFVFEFLLRTFYEYPMLTVGTLLAAGYIAASLHKIGPTEVGLVTKRFSFKKLAKDNPVAFSGEAGYQADLLMPGLRWKAFMVYSVEKYPWVQVPAGEIGVVIAQVGNPLPIGAKSAVYKQELVRIEPQPRGKDGSTIDMVGIVTTYEGDPLPSGDIASRLGGYVDVERLEAPGGTSTDAQIIEALLGSKNNLHNNYQDFQGFLDHGGHIGLQHDPLLYGAYALNPFLVSVEMVPMLMVKQGQVAVMKAYVGLATQDTSGAEFKYGSLVRPGHRGVWQE